MLVCGGRDFSNREYLFVALDALHAECGITTIIEGEAKGVDRLAGIWADYNKVECERYPANWTKYGRKAGPIRNKQMLDEGKPDLVVAFPGGSGTQNMIKQSKEAGVEVIEM